jgi:hypothetical protein|tara:strand:- start:5491 stop:5718 length:228 start_codon:yes stop_codon:yes gene_type:complete
MSAIDPQAEFMSDLDDWYAQLFALRISTAPPVNPRVKEKFFAFVQDRCHEAGDWRLKDDVLASLFSEYLDELANW